MNDHLNFLRSLQHKQEMSKQAGLSDDTAANRHNFTNEAVKPAMRAGVDFKYRTPSAEEKAAMQREKEKAAKMRSTPDTSAAGRASQRMIDARKKMDDEMANRKESVEVDENYEARKVMRKLGVQGVITPKGEIKVPMRDRKRLDAELKKNNIRNYTMSSESVELEEVTTTLKFKTPAAAKRLVGKRSRVVNINLPSKTTQR